MDELETLAILVHFASQVFASPSSLETMQRIVRTTSLVDQDSGATLETVLLFRSSPALDFAVDKRVVAKPASFASTTSAQRSTLALILYRVVFQILLATPETGVSTEFANPSFWEPQFNNATPAHNALLAPPAVEATVMRSTLEPILTTVPMRTATVPLANYVFQDTASP